MAKIEGLTPKDIVELRLKCLEPFVITGSKTGIEQGIVFESAKKAWNFVIEPLSETPKDKPAK